MLFNYTLRFWVKKEKEMTLEFFLVLVAVILFYVFLIWSYG